MTCFVTEKAFSEVAFQKVVLSRIATHLSDSFEAVLVR